MGRKAAQIRPPRDIYDQLHHAAREANCELGLTAPQPGSPRCMVLYVDAADRTKRSTLVPICIPVTVGGGLTLPDALDRAAALLLRRLRFAQEEAA